MATPTRTRRPTVRALTICAPMISALIITASATAGAAGAAAAPRRPQTAPTVPARSGSATSGASSTAPDALRLVAAARAQVGVTTGYDPTYVRLAYPGGDVDRSTGVCSDVVVRAFRALGIDLQQRIHDDMAANFAAYPKKWGLRRPDPNIDHRRVGNIATYFTRRGYSLPVTANAADYLPGDIVTLKIPLDHIGIVSDRKVDGRPLLIHNVGDGAQEEDALFTWTIVGHYRALRN